MKNHFVAFFAKIFNVYDSIANITNSKILDHLSRDEDWEIRREITWNSNTSAETLNFLSRDECCIIRYWVAVNSNTSSETLDFLSHDEHDLVRFNVALNSNTSVETLNFLSRDKNCDIRWRVARNSNTSVETLNFLSHDKDDYVRRIAINEIKSTQEKIRLAEISNDSEILDSLAQDKNSDVRWRVLLNSNTSSLTKLSITF